MKLEIVNHCWRYSRLLQFQLSSLILHPIQNLDVQYTLFFSRDDLATCEVVDWFASKNVPGVRWNWRDLPTPKLLRRAIGRNLAALQTEADWIWFTDTDHLFRLDCLDALPDLLEQCSGPLAFPRNTHIHKKHILGDRLLEAASGPLRLLDIAQVDNFTSRRNSRAIGGIQIARGSVCRKKGYCPNHRGLQRPIENGVFANCRGDPVFRRSLGTKGEAIDLPNLFRIRHSDRGQDSPGLEL